MEKHKSPSERADELYHHGIKGQKWGVRRYQNKDGSLKDAGRARYYEAVKLNEQANEHNKQNTPENDNWTRAKAAAKASQLQYKADMILKDLGPETVAKLKLERGIDPENWDEKASGIAKREKVREFIGIVLGCAVVEGVVGAVGAIYATSRGK